MSKKTVIVIVTAVAVAALALVAHLAGGDIIATAKQHLSGLGR
ncbi:MAG: hypothetical protein Q8M76_17395 [Spirochaetaceae bacterium]|nr:hypothetical protein [Spirochaetaceae bacterium]